VKEIKIKNSEADKIGNVNKSIPPVIKRIIPENQVFGL